MEIIGEKIILRDYIESDIEDHVRWFTRETQWLEWDAPWEEYEFDEENYRSGKKQLLKTVKHEDEFRDCFEICINDEVRTHIGNINSYRIDSHYLYSKEGNNFTIGIGIKDKCALRCGYATEAWQLYIKYLLENGVEEVYTQTWSGNYRVLGLMEKLGFEIVNRLVDNVEVRGKKYDGLTLKLNRKKFKALK